VDVDGVGKWYAIRPVFNEEQYVVVSIPSRTGKNLVRVLCSCFFLGCAGVVKGLEPRFVNEMVTICLLLLSVVLG
jgi:hypothetical protein